MKAYIIFKHQNKMPRLTDLYFKDFFKFVFFLVFIYLFVFYSKDF